jgi:hypothetical protein
MQTGMHVALGECNGNATDAVRRYREKYFLVACTGTSLASVDRTLKEQQF